MNKNYFTKTDNIIALCYILDDFADFEQNLVQLLPNGYDRDLVFKLWDISLGKFVFGTKKIKKFYEQNKAVIDNINAFSDIKSFIDDDYNQYGKSDGNLKYFYNYILEHENEIDKILNVLYKLKQLKFNRFEFNENLEFNDTYRINPTFIFNDEINYLANIEIVDNDYFIQYKSSASNYKMKLGIIDNDISDCRKEIILNSLVFDINTLPDNIDKESVFDYIVALNDEIKYKINGHCLKKQYKYVK